MSNDQTRKAKTNTRHTQLQLEPLESRLMLSATAEGIDADGDVYHIKLLGAGAIASANLNYLEVSGTNIGTRLSVTVEVPLGDGQVNVAAIDTGGSDLGRLQVDGDLGALQAGRVGFLQVDSMDAANQGTTGLYNLTGGAGTFKVIGDIRDADITLGGDVFNFRVGDKREGTGNIINSEIDITGNLQRMQVYQSVTADSSIEISGNAINIDIAQHFIASELDITGNLGRIGIKGSLRNNSSFEVGGDVNMIHVRKAVTDTNIEVTGNISTCIFRSDLRDSTLLCSALESIQVRDDLDNTRIGVTDDLNDLRADDIRNLTLRVSGTLHHMNIKKDMDEALVSSLNGIGSINVGQDMNKCSILGGIDIGADFVLDTVGGGDDSEWGNVKIENILIRGDMIDTSIAAGVSAMGSYYGDGDDVPTADDIGTAKIKRIIVRGQIGSTNMPSESYAISAADGIDLIRSGRGEFLGNTGVVRQDLFNL